MANKFPYLKSTSEPLGVVEQIAAAVTMHPDEDAALADEAEYSWFGRMLAEENFVWQYFGVNGEKEEEVQCKKEFAGSYFNQTLRYTAYDHTTFSLISFPGDYTVVQGKVMIKGWYNKAEHSGDHHFLYFIKKEEERWRVQKWVLRKLTRGGKSALDIILETDVKKELSSA